MMVNEVNVNKIILEMSYAKLLYSITYIDKNTLIHFFWKFNWNICKAKFGFSVTPTFIQNEFFWNKIVIK